MKFSDLNLSVELNQAIEKLNYKECTPIQEQAMPHILEGKDVAGLAQTGTGKTAAFLVPLIERVLRSSKSVSDANNGAVGGGTAAVGDTPPSEAQVTEAGDALQKRAFPDWKPFQFILALVPTRELAEQVYENFNSLSAHTGLRACSIYGGTSYEKQKESLKNGVTLVVATPGRLIDLYKEHLLDLKQVRAVIFDEADRMFDMGFKDDMKYLLQRIPNDRQFLVFSATLNFDVLNTAYQFGANPIEINISRDQAKAENVEDWIFHVGNEDKPKYLLSIMKLHQPKQLVIFSNFKNQIEPLVKFLRNNKIPALGISSLLTQAQRNKVLQQFKEENETQVLVATDVAARGLDIQGIDMVINYELPQDCETYVHRIGRTGRAGLAGKAYSFVGDRDVDSLMRIEEFLKHKLQVAWIEDQNILNDFVPFFEGSRREGNFDRGGGRKFSGEGRFRDKDRGPRPHSHQKPEGEIAVAHGKHNGRPQARPGRSDVPFKKDHPKKDNYQQDRDHNKKREEGPQKRDHNSKTDFNQKREPSHRRDQYQKPFKKSYNQTGQKPSATSKTNLPVRKGVYKINLWYRVVRFLKGMFR